MNTNHLLALVLFVFAPAGSLAQLKYLDCGIDFACPYFSG